MMSKRDKLRSRLRNNPKGIKFSDLETLLGRFGFVLVRVSGSHHLFRYTSTERVEKVVIPVHNNQVKAIYVREVLDVLDALFPEGANEAPSDDESEDENE